QRVQLARVLCQVWEPTFDGRPRWLFLDEPVSSLDIAHQLDVMAIAQDFARGGGGVVAVMHDLNLTAMFADKIAVMHQGRLVADGTPQEVMTDATLSRVYGCDLSVNQSPGPEATYILPHTALR
ncbi:MAG: iron ABC transporter, partial [Pseudomonadota bacterium]